MKETIKHYFPLILTVLGAIYGIYIIFYSITDLQQLFQNTSTKDYSTLVAKALSTQMETSIPSPVYVGNTLVSGENYSFSTLFKLTLSDGSLVSVDTLPDTALYLVDVKTPSQNSILTKLSTSDIENLDSIPSSCVYDTQQQLLCFHNSGIYTLLIRLYTNHRPGILFECQIPVEVR